MAEEACPGCGTRQSTFSDVSGFHCATCQADVWRIDCAHCQRRNLVTGSAVGADSLSFRCASCGKRSSIGKQKLRSISAAVERRSLQESAARQREMAARLRQHEKEKTQAARDAITASRLALSESRAKEAAKQTDRAQQRLAELGSILTTGIGRPCFGWESLRAAAEFEPFIPPKAPKSQPPAKPIPPNGKEPSLAEYLPPEMTHVASWIPGGKKKQERRVEAARFAFQQAHQAWAWEMAQYQAALTQHDEAEKELRSQREAFEAARRTAEAEYERLASEHQAAVDKHNRALDEMKGRFADCDPAAVSWYLERVLAGAELPYDSGASPRVAYSPASRQLVIELELPNVDVVPDSKSFRYVKAKDQIVPDALPATQRKSLYSSLVAQVALHTLNQAFRSCPAAVVESVAVNGHVSAIDKRTGQPVHPCLVTVRVSRDRFETINLRQVDPVECLRGLSASLSRSPSELLPVRPVVGFDMVDPRFVREAQILSALDTRSNLMDLSPNEFESLITNLFERMGLETRLTQASRDGGVDCVAYDTRPIFGGKVVIQAKRYAKTVGVSAVRDLFGTMQNEGATKGILVTTSGYGQASHDFANGKPLELIDGGNLLFLLKEHAGVDAKIEPPEDWVDPQPDW